MTDPVRQILDRFPENKDVIRLLRETDPRFGTLCEEYVAVIDRLDALAHTEDVEASARASVLRERCMAIEEELLTAIEGYRPV